MNNTTEWFVIKMLNRSILTAIIGFLVGCLLYYLADVSVVIVLIMGCTGYFFGLILDNADIKHQLDNFHFSNISSTQEIFRSADIPEALIVYSSKENLTTVSIDFQVDTKPQTFRLSVLKNLQEHQFRILEDSSKTIINLTLDYPDWNYPKISSSEKRKEFHYDIKERSLDFQNAVQKIIPGLVLSIPSHPNLFEDGSLSSRFDGSSSQLPPPSNSLVQSLNGVKRSHPIPEGIDLRSTLNPTDLSTNESAEEYQGINESQIMEDLFSSSSVESKIPNLSSKDVQHLKDSNQQQLEVFLNEGDENDTITSESLDEKAIGKEIEIPDDIQIDYTNVDQPGGSSTIVPVDFNQVIISRLEEQTKMALNKIKPDLELEKERDEVKKYFDGKADAGESVS
ncbi:MAG: hypothetical protein ACFFAE_20815 [Candidatus Hodarchaeota archaeon]